jgi:hypothetical protein
LVWRVDLLRDLRAGRGFARAALLSAAVVAAQHLLLFATLPAAVAAAAVGVAIATSFAFARLFELARGPCLGPAVVHAAVQGAPRVVVVEGSKTSWGLLAWMPAGVGLPLSGFVVRSAVGSAAAARQPSVGPDGAHGAGRSSAP